MAKDGHPDSSSGETPESEVPPASGDPKDSLGPDSEAESSSASWSEEDEELSLELGMPPDPDRSESEFVELGEPIKPPTPSDSGDLVLGEPSQHDEAPSEGEMSLGEPFRFGDGDESGEGMVLGEPGYPLEEGASGGELLLGEPLVIEPPPPVVPIRPATGKKKGGGRTVATVADRKGNGWLFPAVAAALLAVAAVPSYLFYQDLQGRFEAARNQLALNNDLTASAKTAREVAEAKVASTTKQKAEVEAELKAATDAKGKADELTLKAEQEKVAAIKKAEEEKAEAIKKVEDERVAAIAKVEAEKAALQTRLDNLPKDQNIGKIGPAPEIARAVTSIKEGQLEDGVKQIVNLVSESDQPDYFDEVIKGLGEWLDNPQSRSLLIEACVKAEKKADAKNRASFALFLELLNDNRGANATSSAVPGRRADGPGPGSNLVHLASSRVGQPLAGPTRLVVPQAGANLVEDEKKLRGLIKKADEILMDTPPGPAGGSRRVLIRYSLRRVLDQLELANLLGQGDEFDRVLDATLKASKDVQDRIKAGSSTGQAEEYRELPFLKRLDEVIRRNQVAIANERQVARELGAVQAELAAVQPKIVKAESDLKATGKVLEATQRELLAAKQEVAELKELLKASPARQVQIVIEERDEARRKLAEALGKIRLDGYLAYASGVEGFGAKDYPRAEANFSLAIDKYPRDPRFFYYRGIIRYQLVGTGAVTLDQSANDIREGVRLERANMGSFHEIGHVLHRLPNEVTQWVESIRHPAGLVVGG